MFKVEPRDEDPNVNIVLQSGMRTSDDKGKQPKEGGWVCKALEKEFGFDLKHAKEMFMEEEEKFSKESTSRI